SEAARKTGGGQAQAHAQVAKVRIRMTECRQFPVEYCTHTRRVRIENKIVETEITMDQADLAIISRQVRRQPVDDRLHVRQGFRFRRTILLDPATQLALEIIARLAVIGEADLLDRKSTRLNS